MITPSTIFERYCTPITDGKLLCDINNNRELALDINEALAAIGIGGAQDDEDVMNGQDIDIPISPTFGNSNNSVDINETEETSMILLTDSSADASPEVFPLLLGSVLIIATVVFTMITLLTIYKRFRSNHNEDVAGGEEETSNEHRPTVFRRNTWIKRAGDDEDDGAGLSNQKVLMSWKNLSCAYTSKNGEDNVTLQGVTGHIKYNELVAIMGGSG